MPTRDLHDQPFDEATLAKLEIFEEYTKQWLPTFIYGGAHTICIIDFFAGPGYDKGGEQGSPIRILKTIEIFYIDIISKSCKIKVYLNEFDHVKYSKLKDNVSSYLEEHPRLKEIIDLDIDKKDFEDKFKELYTEILKYPCLIFSDQNGIKFFSEEYLNALEKTNTTDFLYFLSSSYIWRFGEIEEFKKYLKIDFEKLKQNPYKFIHRSLIEQIKNNLPKGTKMKLFPFSIKKNANIYGIVFGAKHLRAVEKFLDVVWKKNPINGEANFDIEDDESKRQGHLFEKNLTKREKFDTLLEDFIKGKIEVTNKEIYIWTLENGHPPKHASEQLSILKKEKKIYYTGKPRINYDSIFNDRVLIEIKWLENEKN